MRTKNNTNKLTIIVIFLFLTLSLLLASKYLGRYFDKTSNMDYVSDQGGSVEFVSDRNLRRELPENFPSHFPIYENTTIDESWETQIEDAHAVSVVWRVAQKPESVFNFYEEELLMADYEIDILLGDENSYTITFSNESESGFIGIAKDGQETLISVTMKR